MLSVGGVSQVQIDVVVAQVARSKFRALAFNFLSDSQHSFLYSTVGQAVSTPTSIGAGGQVGVNGLLIGAPGTPNGAAANIFFGVLHDVSGFMAFMQALTTEDVSKLLAQPSVVVQSGQIANFLSGGQQAIPAPGGLGTVSVEYKDFGTKLDVLPIVLGNGKIHLELRPEVSDIDSAHGTSIGGTSVPGFIKQSVQTTVELEDGQTFAIGGLIQHSVAGHLEKVPVLGDLPFIGSAFSSKSYKEIETELIILVTPHLVDAMTGNQLPCRLPGQETRSPDNFELFLLQMLEAPLGNYPKWQDRRFVAPHMNPEVMEAYPCPAGGAGCQSAVSQGRRVGIACPTEAAGGTFSSSGQCVGGGVETFRSVAVPSTPPPVPASRRVYPGGADPTAGVNPAARSGPQRGPVVTPGISSFPRSAVGTQAAAVPTADRGNKSASGGVPSAEFKVPGTIATAPDTTVGRIGNPSYEGEIVPPIPVSPTPSQPKLPKSSETSEVSGQGGGPVETLQEGITLGPPLMPESGTSAASQEGATFPK